MAGGNLFLSVSYLVAPLLHGPALLHFVPQFLLMGQVSLVLVASEHLLHI